MKHGLHENKFHLFFKSHCFESKTPRLCLVSQKYLRYVWFQKILRKEKIC